MLKPNELRIGSYVNYRGHLNLVTGITPPYPSEDPRWDGKWVIEINPPDVFNVTLDELEPVELTHEIAHNLAQTIANIIGKDYKEFSGTDYYPVTLDADSYYCIRYMDWRGDWSFYIEYTDVVYEFDDKRKFPLNCALKHLHQLQNMCFSLTGEELKLTKEYKS